MSDYQRSYRKPDGSLTEDAEEHAWAWSEFADEVETMFPGYAVFGLDPGLSFRPIGPNRYDTFSLPLGACKALLEYKRKAAKPMKVILTELEQTCGGCPTSWSARTTDGNAVYIRYRYGHLVVDFDDEIVFETAHGDSMDGIMTTEEMLKITGYEVHE